MDQIAMAHPDIPGEVAHATQEAFDLVWARRGWVVVDEPDEAVEPGYNEDAVKASKDDPETVEADPDSNEVKAAKGPSTVAPGNKQGEVGIDG